MRKKNRLLVFSGSQIIPTLGSTVQWKHGNVKMMSPFRISAHSGFSGSLFYFFQYKTRYLVVSKKKNPLFAWWLDRKICPLQSPFFITLQASWCQSVILGTDFFIAPLHPWCILIFWHIQLGYLSLPLHPYFLYTSRKGSGESVHMCRLTRAFVAPGCDTYRTLV